MRHIYLQQLVASNFAKNREKKHQRKIRFEHVFFPSLSVVLALHNVPKTVFWVNQNGGAQADVRGGEHAPLALRNDGTEAKAKDFKLCP